MWENVGKSSSHRAHVVTWEITKGYFRGWGKKEKGNT